MVGDHRLAGEVEGVMGMHILVYYDSVVGVYIVGYILLRPCLDLTNSRGILTFKKEVR